jgi:putative FmdB family regulatory protein
MTYEYVCTSCGNAWEAEQRISEPALDTCPKCNEKTAKRQISGGGAFILKGGGWYSDLYSSSGSKSTTSSSTASGSTSTPAASTPAASAPATPAASTSTGGSGSST